MIIRRNTKPVRFTTFHETNAILYSPNLCGDFCILKMNGEKNIEPKKRDPTISMEVVPLSGHDQTLDLPRRC